MRSQKRRVTLFFAVEEFGRILWSIASVRILSSPPFVAGDTLNNPASDGLVEYIRGETEKSLRIKKDDILY